MQLHIMDCKGRSHINERDSELGDDMSQDEHSEEEMRDCDSVEADEISRLGSRLNTSINSNGADTAGDMTEPEQLTDIAICHRQQFPTNHPLNALGSFMGIGSLHGIQNLQHNDVLEKLKMQVRDIKVGLMDKEYAAAHVAAFGQNVIPTPINTTFTLPPTTMASFTHAAHTLAGQAGNNLNSHLSTNFSTCSAGGPSVSSGSHDSFSFTSPTAPTTKDVNPAANSSPSSETSNSSQQNNGWSFEEQYKQVRQLYEINDDPKRKEFLDDLFSFMQKRGTPINRLPIMAKSVLDLYELYNLVIARGGLVDVINKKLWQEIIKGLHLPSSITSAAFTLRTQYMKYLYPYECEKKNLSTPAELKAAIESNRREGRRSSYSQYEGIHNQMQIPQITHQSLSGGLQQMSPLALVTHATSNHQAQAAAAAAAAHHRLLTPSFGQVPNIVTQEIEQRMIEYLKLIQVKKEHNARSKGPCTMGLSSHQPQHHSQQQQQYQEQQHQRSQSPDINTREALNALEMSRVALWQIYHNTTSPPVSVNTSPQNHGNLIVDGRHDSSEEQREVLNLSDSPPALNSIKREREREPSLEINEHNDFQHEPPPPKRVGIPANFYLPPIISGISAVTNRANSNHKGNDHNSDTELDEEIENDGSNTTTNFSQGDTNQRQHLNGSSFRAASHHNSNGSTDNEKFDDSAIENSPSNSAASAGNGHNSPVSTKKFNLTKPTQQQYNASNTNNTTSTCADNMTTANCTSLRSFDALNLFSGMEFCITRNGTNSNGKQELVVNLKLNGVKYSGVLIENLPNPATETVTSTEIIAPTTAMEDKSAKNKNNVISYTHKTASQNHIQTTVDDSSGTSKEIVVDMDACEDPNELALRDNEILPNSCTSTITTTTPTINQGIVPNISSNAPKHTLITS